MINKLQIRETALLHGFKLKEQADGTMDLNPYVYTAIEKCIEFNERLKDDCWISVDDRLPERAGRYLCYRASKKMQDVEPLLGDLASDKAYLKILGVTHWRALPNPPEE